MGERLVRNEEVRGSIPLSSTTRLYNPLILLLKFPETVNFALQVYTSMLYAGQEHLPFQVTSP